MRKTLITTSLIAAVVAMPAFADPTAQELLDQKTVTSKYYVDTTKQDKITTDKVLFFEDKNPSANVYVPALVLTNAAGTALNGNTVGVLDRGTLSSVFNTNLNSFYTAATYDNFVPTVRAVATELSSIWTSLNNTLSWTSTETSAVNAYDTDFNKGMWPSDDSTKYITGSSLAYGLALKQNKIVAGKAGDVVTYTGTEGQVGSTAVSSAATYNGTTLTNGNDIANIAAVETAVAAVETAKQDKMTCAGYVPGHENDIDYCWLYGDIQVAAAAAPTCVSENGACGSGIICCSGLTCSDPNGKGTCVKS